MGTRASEGSKTVVKAFRILQAFHHPGEWVSCAELSRRAELSEATAQRLVRTLADVGAIQKDMRGLFQLSPGSANNAQPAAFGDPAL
jgi:DNA-binding IclR family transcriptional regulator